MRMGVSVASQKLASMAASVVGDHSAAGMSNIRKVLVNKGLRRAVKTFHFKKVFAVHRSSEGKKNGSYKGVDFKKPNVRRTDSPSVLDGGKDSSLFEETSNRPSKRAASCDGNLLKVPHTNVFSRESGLRGLSEVKHF